MGKIFTHTTCNPCRRRKQFCPPYSLDRSENLNTLRQRFIAEGVFIRPFGSIVYLTPAFTIAEEELAKLMDAICRVLGEHRCTVT